MIYSKQKNFIFLRVPKTASTSLYHEILDSFSCKDEVDAVSYVQHESLQNLNFKYESKQKLYEIPHPNITNLLNEKIINEAELKGLNVYGVIREPIDRIISCAHHFYIERSHKNLMMHGMVRRPILKIVDKYNAVISQSSKTEYISNDEVVDFFFKECITSKKIVLDKPQTFWLKHNNKPINKIFRFDQINNLLKELCGKDSMIYYHRSQIRVDKRNQLSNSLRLEIIKRYSEDFDLWESLQ